MHQPRRQLRRQKSVALRTAAFFTAMCCWSPVAQSYACGVGDGPAFHEEEAAPPAAASCLIDVARALPTNAQVVDVRTVAEHSSLSIPGSVNRPLQSLVNTGHDALVVYDGGRLRSDSLALCERLRRYGLRNFQVIDGGIAAWAQMHHPSAALAVSRLSDAEASAALIAGGSKVVVHSEALLAVLKKHSVDVAPKGNDSSRRTLILAGEIVDHDRLEAELARKTGENTALYWIGAPQELDSLIASHLAQDARRRNGPMVNYNCPGL